MDGSEEFSEEYGSTESLKVVEPFLETIGLHFFEITVPFLMKILLVFYRHFVSEYG